MKFEIRAGNSSGENKTFYYDNEKNSLVEEDGTEYKYYEQDTIRVDYASIPFDKNSPPTKLKLIANLKIQLGLSCNYSCDYCSQKFVERAPETSKKDIDAFLEMLDTLTFNEEVGLKIEFWGGEPLVYWKTLKPLAEKLAERFESWEKKPQFAIITNGSLLTTEIIDWLMMLNFNVSISHDGPGQSVRGPDPFDDPEKKELILGFYRMMTRLGRGFSFNPMMNAKNKSRKAVYDWFVELTGDPEVKLGEGSIVDAYDEDGATNSLQTLQDHFEYRRQAFADIYSTGGEIGFFGQLNKVDSFVNSVLSQTPAETLGQKCGMDQPYNIAVDLRGNVITCQNVSAAETAMNGESHNCGNLKQFDDIAVKTVTHWKNREHCSSCPVLHICKGSCMFLEGKFWEISCANSYSDNVALFALGIYNMTGYIPTMIIGEGLPLERQDIWGTVFTHEEKPKKKIIPIKVISKKSTTIDDVEVYGKSHIV